MVVEVRERWYRYGSGGRGRGTGVVEEVREWWYRYGSGGRGTGAVVEVRERW